MSAPRVKRQFAGEASDSSQRQITNFFTPTSTSLSQPSHHQPLCAPNLPANVQSNLLSVGMRVRKSVPEGYKTRSQSAPTTTPFDQGRPHASVAVAESQRGRANAFSSPRELMPFCGIHKVGGLETQSTDRPVLTHNITSFRAEYQATFSVDEDDDEDNDEDNDEEMPGLTSTQESVDSKVSQSRKRFFQEEEQYADPQLLNHGLAFCGPQHQLHGKGRPIAMPRNGKARHKAAVPAIFAQDSIKVVNGDFEEAEFLDAGTWDVNMSDT
ncbi:ribonucleotide reductase inhibitor-domain-containing protein [Poronia punctata]|nr:ribonucleotide reductase inhibitor-domain-containing protein [Poronia punctata]